MHRFRLPEVAPKTAKLDGDDGYVTAAILIKGAGNPSHEFINLWFDGSLRRPREKIRPSAGLCCTNCVPKDSLPEFRVLSDFYEQLGTDELQARNWAEYKLSLKNRGIAFYLV